MFDTPAIEKLFSAFPDAEENIRFVGGCVRDDVLGLPCEDIDLCTTYTPQEVIEYLKAADIKFVPSGLQHGTVMAILEGRGYEITTLRHDLETDGRHATVAFTKSFEEDAARRDFTINALSRDRSGKVYDYWNGLSDLKTGVVRFIGNPQDRIREDYLRILRFFRFHARFSSSDPDADTIHAIQTLSEGLVGISGERIQSELYRLLATTEIRPTLSLMLTCQIFKPSLNIDVSLEMITKLFELETEFALQPIALTRLLALMTLDLGKLETITKRIKLSRKDHIWMDTVRHIALDFGSEPLKIHLYYQGQDKVREAYILSQAISNSSPSLLVLDQINTYAHKPFPQSGQDLMDEGIQPGPDLGKELKRREREWILSS